MSKVTQIYSLINEISKQVFGEKAVSAIDTASFVQMGDTVFSSDTNKESYLNALVDRIGKTVISNRRYISEGENMVRHEFEFGCILQKIYVELPEAKENKAWEIGKPGYSPEYAPVIKPSAKQKLFNGISTWEIDVTIPDFMFKTAFTSPTAMATFVDAIFTAMDNMMEIAMENNANMTRANFIANKLHNAGRCTAIDLLKQYNTLTNAGLTKAAALRNTEFLKWATMQISLWINRMTKMSKLFNDEGYKRFTPKSDIVVDVLQDFASATESFLEADTYHKELVSLPGYNAVPYWQASGEDYDFASTSKIIVKIDGVNTITQDGIIACVYDYQAMGITMNDRRTSTERNNKDEYTNYYNKASIGYFNDLSENGIVFYMSEG